MPHRWFSALGSDIRGGLVSATVAIPLAMGYGMFVFSALGERYFSAGALAGLATAFIAGVACVILGDRTTNVFAPRIVTTFFLGLLLQGFVHSDVETIRSGATPLALLFAVILLGAVFQALFGLVKVGTLIRYTPFPVMAGFQNAAAILLFLVQLGNVFGFDRNVSYLQALGDLESVKPLSIAIATITFVAMWNSRRILPRVPPLLVGIALGTALYYGLGALGLGARLGPVIAREPETALGMLQLSDFADVARDADMLALLPTIVGGAFALAIIASIDALLCARLVTPPGSARIDGDALLARLGVANAAAACVGGITSGLNIGASAVNRAFGARTPLSVLVNSAAILLACTALFPLFCQLPRSVLSAVIMVVAIQHIDPWTLRLARGCITGTPGRRRSRALDLCIVVVVAILSVALDIVLAVFIGLAFAVVLFIARMSTSVIRRSYRCGMVRSRRARTAEEARILERHGDAILVLELRGALFFGTGETLLREVDAALRQETRAIVLDTRRLTEIDSTGARTLLDLDASLALANTRLLLVATRGSDSMQRLDESGVLESITPARLFPDLDRAIQAAEDDLLDQECRTPSASQELALADLGLLARFEPHEVATLADYLTRVDIEKGREIFREGDPGVELMVIAKGAASAYLASAGGSIRLATFGAGIVFGEMALLDEGRRAATLVADEELVCYSLDRTSFALLAARAPSVAIKLLANLGREMSARLRTANRTIQQLES